MLISDYLSSNIIICILFLIWPTYFRELGQKCRNIFVRFLVQMKTSKNHSEINWPLVNVESNTCYHFSQHLDASALKEHMYDSM